MTVAEVEDEKEEEKYNVDFEAFNADGTDKNIVIYGHNRKDGSMFETLKDIFKEDWYSNEQNKYITYITENE